MASTKLSGAKTIAFSAPRGTLIGSGALAANSWYEIATVGTSPAIPIMKVGAIFKTPDTTGTAITLASGDSVFPLTLTRVCKTDVTISLEEGTIDVTDDCEEGFAAEILDGYKKISGSLNGYASFDDTTGAIETNTLALFNRFINKVTDNGLGAYSETTATNDRFLLFILLNRDAAATQTQNYLIVPIFLSSLGSGAGLKDAQKRDLSFTKAPGYTCLYQRVAFSDDVI